MVDRILQLKEMSEYLGKPLKIRKEDMIVIVRDIIKGCRVIDRRMSIYFVIGNCIWMEYQKNTKYLYCIYEGFFGILRNEFGLDNDEIGRLLIPELIDLYRIENLDPEFVTSCFFFEKVEDIISS